MSENMPNHEQEWREAHWVHDPRKAEAMAHAEDPIRTDAAYERSNARTLAEYPEKSAEIYQAKEALGDRPIVNAFLPKKKARQLSQLQNYESTNEQLREQSNDLWHGMFSAASHAEDALDYSDDVVRLAEHSATNERAKTRLLEIADKLLERSKEADKKAAAIGEWAGVLHEYPPSEAFFKSVSKGSLNFDLTTPNGLYETEQMLQKSDGGDSLIDELDSLIVPDLQFDDAEEVIMKVVKAFHLEDSLDEQLGASFAEARSAIKELNRLVKTAYDDEMRVKDIKKRSLEIAQVAKEIIHLEHQALKRALEDIKSGKACESNYRVVVPDEHLMEIKSEEARRHLKEAERWSVIAENRTGSERERALDIAHSHDHHALAAQQAAAEAAPHTGKTANHDPDGADGTESDQSALGGGV